MPRSTPSLDAFEQWLRLDGPQVSERTAFRYRRYVEQFEREFGDLATLSEERARELKTWVVGSETSPAAASTVNVKLSALKAYRSYRRFLGEEVPDLGSSLSLLRVPQRLPRPLPEATLKKLFDAVYASSGALALQDRMLFELLYGSGLRREEVTTLLLSNVEGRYTLRIIGKGNKERRTVLTEPGYRAIREWIVPRLRDELSLRVLRETDEEGEFVHLCHRFPDTPLLYTESGVPVRELAYPGDFVYQRVEKYAKEIGESFSPHQLRHSFCTDLLNNGGDFLLVSEAAGHGDLRTTKGYTAVLDKGLRALRRAHPRV